MLRHIPNILTLSRGLVLVLILLSAPLASMKGAVWAFSFVIYGIVSDFLDGWLSRRFNWISDFGKLADALLDKVFVVGLYIYLIVIGLIPSWGWAIIAITLLRDQIVNYLRAKGAAAGVVFPASQVGKVKTACQMACLIGFFILPMISNYATIKEIDLSLYWNIVYGISMLIFLTATYLTISSGIFYVKNYLPAIREAKENKVSQ